jgi:hypothetical protein
MTRKHVAATQHCICVYQSVHVFVSCHEWTVELVRLNLMALELRIKLNFIEIPTLTAQ